MIFDSLDATATRHGFDLAVRIEPDDTYREPWKESDGHGPVSDWERRDKAPGELVLCGDSRGYCGTDTARRFYDFAEACRIARRDGWQSLWPYKLSTRYVRGAWEATAREQWRHPGELPMLTARRKDINRAVRDIYAQRLAQLGSKRAMAANAARGDYEYLRAWCNDDWRYVGVIVTASKREIELGSASLWGIESDATDYLLETANDLAAEAIDEARSMVAQLTE